MTRTTTETAAEASPETSPEASFRTPSPEDISQLFRNIHLAEAASRAALQEVWDTRSRLKRMEASMALVLGALTSLGDAYVLHRLSQEMRRFAEAPEEAAGLVGCDDRHVDPVLMKALAAHLTTPDGETWQAPQPAYAVMH